MTWLKLQELNKETGEFVDFKDEVTCKACNILFDRNVFHGFYDRNTCPRCKEVYQAPRVITVANYPAMTAYAASIAADLAKCKFLKENKE